MQIKNRQKLLAIVAASGLGLLALDNLVIEPLLKSWKERSEQIVKLERTLDRNTQLLAREKEILGSWDRVKINTLQGDTSTAAGQMYKGFDRWSQASRISITSIKPQWKQTEDDYTTLECRADATGNMDSIARFLHEIEKDPLAVKVEVVEITSRDNNGQQLTLGLQVSGLLLLPKQ